jgi:3-hydroxyisobutyrate dehydrogenase
MARRLKAAGFEVVGCDADTATRARLAAEIEVAEATDAFPRADAALLSLPNSAIVEQVALGPGGFLERAQDGALLIDTSTAAPSSTRLIAEKLAARGLAMLDAPVSGGAAGAADGKLTVMLGGPDEAVERARPVLAPLAARVVHVGASGAGNVAKLANNLLCAAHLVTASEAVRLAREAGVPPERLLEVVNVASGRSAITEVNMARWILSGAFDSGFTMGLMRKDVGLALDLARELGLDLALSGEVGRLWRDRSAAIPDGADFNRIVELAGRAP